MRRKVAYVCDLVVSLSLCQACIVTQRQALVFFLEFKSHIILHDPSYLKQIDLNKILCLACVQFGNRKQEKCWMPNPNCPLAPQAQPSGPAGVVDAIPNLPAHCQVSGTAIASQGAPHCTPFVEVAAWVSTNLNPFRSLVVLWACIFVT